MTKCLLTRGVRLLEVSVSGGSTALCRFPWSVGSMWLSSQLRLAAVKNVLNGKSLHALERHSKIQYNTILFLDMLRQKA